MNATHVSLGTSRTGVGDSCMILLEQLASELFWEHKSLERKRNRASGGNRSIIFALAASFNFLRLQECFTTQASHRYKQMWQ